MDALLDEPEPAQTDQSPAHSLRANMAAVRVSFTWMGTRKTLTPEQRAQAAQPFDAEGQYLSAGKKLLDTSHSAFKAVTSIRSKIASTWKSMSLPFPEPGVRLIKRDEVANFATLLTDYRTELAEAVANLDRHYGDLKAAAAERLGRLFNPGDYPETLVGLFDVSWDFPSVEPPDYLRELNPALYEAERARVAARFDEAVQLAEAAFLEEFGKLVSHLSERISSVGEDGKPKVFRDSAIGNLGEFFERFRNLALLPIEWVTLDRFSDFWQHAREDFEAKVLFVPKSVGPSLDDADLVVDALNEAQRHLVLLLAIRRDSVPVVLDHPGELLVRLEALPSQGRLPSFEESPRPLLPLVVPQLAEHLLEQVGFVQPPVGLEQRLQRQTPLLRQVGPAGQQCVLLALDEPPVLAREPGVLTLTNLVQGLVQALEDVKLVVEDAGLGRSSPPSA